MCVALLLCIGRARLVVTLDCQNSVLQRACMTLSFILLFRPAGIACSTHWLWNLAGGRVYGLCLTCFSAVFLWWTYLLGLSLKAFELYIFCKWLTIYYKHLLFEPKLSSNHSANEIACSSEGRNPHRSMSFSDGISNRSGANEVATWTPSPIVPEAWQQLCTIFDYPI